MKRIMENQIVGLLLGASLLVGCAQGAGLTSTSGVSPEKQTSSANSSSDTCTLLSQDEVSSVLGQTVTSAEGSGLGGVCTYTTQDFRFDLTVSSTGGVQYLKNVRTNAGDSATTIPGLGNDALFNTNSNTLFVVKGDAVYLFSLSDTNYSFPQDGQAKLAGLAAKLVSHLP